MWTRRMAVGALALVAACSSIAPGNISGAVDMVVVTYDPAAGKYVLKTEQINTLKKLRTLEGDAAKIELGANLSVDLAAIREANPQTTDAFQQKIFSSVGKSADFDYFVSEDIVHPADADALALATTYYNFESAQLLFADLGITLPAVRVAYDSAVMGQLPAKLSPLTDSALSQPFLRAFVVPPASSSSDLPPGMQLGVVGHQYSHAVFQSQVFPGEALPWIETKMTSATSPYRPTDNLLRSIDEGVADYFGAVLSEDATFVRTAPGKPDEDRRLDPANARCAPPDLADQLQGQNREQYNPYVLGSIISSILWEIRVARPELDIDLQLSIMKWEKALGTQAALRQTNLSLPEALEALAQNLSENTKAKACGLLFDRFRYTKVQIPSCTVNSTVKKCAL